MAFLTLTHMPFIASGKGKSQRMGPISKEMYAQRVEHASELLGRHYKSSVVRTTEEVRKIHGALYRWTREGLPKKYRRDYQTIAQTIIDEAYKHSLDPVLLAAVIMSESSFNPEASGTSGEIGLMQILPSTGKWMAEVAGLKWNGKKTLRDPVQNIRLGAAYIAWLREKFDSHARLYLAAYNMGQRNVRNALSRKVWPKEYPIRVMQNYVAYYSDLKEKTLASKKSVVKTLAQN